MQFGSVFLALFFAQQSTPLSGLLVTTIEPVEAKAVSNLQYSTAENARKTAEDLGLHIIIENKSAFLFDPKILDVDGRKYREIGRRVIADSIAKSGIPTTIFSDKLTKEERLGIMSLLATDSLTSLGASSFSQSGGSIVVGTAADVRMNLGDKTVNEFVQTNMPEPTVSNTMPALKPDQIKKFEQSEEWLLVSQSPYPKTLHHYFAVNTSESSRLEMTFTWAAILKKERLKATEKEQESMNALLKAAFPPGSLPSDGDNIASWQNKEFQQYLKNIGNNSKKFGSEEEARNFAANARFAKLSPHVLIGYFSNNNGKPQGVFTGIADR